MHEANELCDRIGIINKGKIVKIGTPKDLKELIEKNIVVEIGLSKPNKRMERELKKLSYVIHVCATREGLKVILDKKQNLKRLMGKLSKHDLESFDEREPSLEDVFIKLTRKC
jgi:ABC-2 type transport system ATP-binding protein